MIRFLEISNQMLFWYYLATNLAYLVMLIIALKTSARHQRRLESHRLSRFKETPMTPPITIIAPAHNEEGSIRVAIRNLYSLDDLPDKETSHRIATLWRPYATVASWYCWRSLEFKD